MSEMNFKDYILNEMHLEDWSDSNDAYVDLIAFRSHIWLGQRETVSKSRAQKIYRTIKREHPKVDKPYQTIDNWGGLVDWVRDSIPDAVTGAWSRSDRSLSIPHSDWMSPVSSPLIKKVAAALKAKEVTSDVEMDFTKQSKDRYSYSQNRNSDYESRTVRFPRRKLLGRLPDHMFHGTTTKYLSGILKTGLRPDQSDTNYSGIYHSDKVFLASRFEDAESHAAHTVHLQGGYPLVIEFAIPDPDKIVPDFDVDSHASRNTYGHTNQKLPPASVDSWRMTRHAGLVGYQGFIPPIFIRSVFLRPPQQGSLMGKTAWRKVRLDTLKKRVQEDPWDWGYKYGLFD